MHKDRIFFAILKIVVSVVLSAILGVIFAAALGGLSTKNFFYFSLTMFFCAGAPLVIAGLMEIFTRLDEKFTFGLGCGLYYGTIAGAEVVDFFSSMEKTGKFVIGAVIAILVCYIVWLKSFKDPGKEDKQRNQ